MKTRPCTLGWCDRPATYTAAEGTGYMFYLCAEHGEALTRAGLKVGIR